MWCLCVVVCVQTCLYLPYNSPTTFYILPPSFIESNGRKATRSNPAAPISPTFFPEISRINTRCPLIALTSHAAALTLVSFVPDSPLPSQPRPSRCAFNPPRRPPLLPSESFMLRVAMGRPRHEDRLLFVGIVGAKISASGNPPASSSGQRYLRGTKVHSSWIHRGRT